MSYAGVDYDDGWYRDKAETALGAAVSRARNAEAKVAAAAALLDQWEQQAQTDHDSSQHHYASVAVARRLQALRDATRECAADLRSALGIQP